MYFPKVKNRLYKHDPSKVLPENSGAESILRFEGREPRFFLISASPQRVKSNCCTAKRFYDVHHQFFPNSFNSTETNSSERTGTLSLARIGTEELFVLTVSENTNTDLFLVLVLF